MAKYKRRPSKQNYPVSDDSVNLWTSITYFSIPNVYVRNGFSHPTLTDAVARTNGTKLSSYSTIKRVTDAE